MAKNKAPEAPESTYLQVLDAKAEARAQQEEKKASAKHPKGRAAREKQPTSARRLLFPLIPLYRLALAFHELQLFLGLEPVRRLRLPVVSIGNLSTGGSGKTPLAITLAKALKQRGMSVDILSRGYGRQSQLAARVLPDGTAEEFGDEPLLIAEEAGLPVYVAPQRYDAGLLAEADAEAAAKLASISQPAISGAAASGPTDPNSTASGRADQQPPAPERAPVPAKPQPGAAVNPVEPVEAGVQPFHLSSSTILAHKSPAEGSSAPEEPAENAPPPLSVHLLDDGFQHRQLARAVDILLINQQDWRDWLLPAGNLREPLEAARRASVIAIPANEPELEAELYVWGWDGPIWQLHRKMDIPLVQSPIAAFCGIARPEQFFAGLEAVGLEVALQLAFPDHFSYTREVLEELLAKAREKEVTAVVTTGKDLARLGKLAALFPKSMPLAATRLRIEIEDQSAAIDWLVERLKASAPHPHL